MQQGHSAFSVLFCKNSCFVSFYSSHDLKRTLSIQRQTDFGQTQLFLDIL